MIHLAKIKENTYSAIYQVDIKKEAEIEVGSIGRWTKSSLRSADQNNGYWGVIIPQIVEQLEARGTEFPVGLTKEDVVHALMHRLFLTTIDFMGVQVTVSTSKLTKEEMSEFYEKIARWYAETFHVEMRMPEKKF